MRHPFLRNSVLALAVFGGLFTAGQYLIKPGFTRLGWLNPPATLAHASAEPVAALPLPEPSLAAEVARQSSHRVLPASAAPLPVRLLATAPSRPAAAVTPALQTLLLIDGAAAPVGTAQPVALPDGTRFRLQLRSAEPARVEVSTIAPDGRTSAGPLWQAELAPGGVVESPRLRLDGMTGMETLRVLRRSLRDGSVSEERVRLLHD